MDVLKLSILAGVAPHQLEAAWTVSEFAEAMALQAFDPWGDVREDMRTALLAAVSLAGLTGKRNIDPLQFNLGYQLKRVNAGRRIDPRDLSAQHAGALAAMAAMLPKDEPRPATRTGQAVPGSS